MPLDFDVEDKVKSSIWALEFVYLQSLKEPDVVASNTYSIDISSPYGSERLSLGTSRKPKPFTHIAQWLDAFNIFITVYTQKFPEDIHNLLTYQRTIKTMASEGGDWQGYDIQFRKLFKGRRVPWNKPHQELHNRCSKRSGSPSGRSSYSSNQSFRSNQSNQSNQSRGRGRSNRQFRPSSNGDSSKSRHPKGSCFVFHDTGNCTFERCTFSHKCYSPGCGAVHPVYTCGRADSQSKSAPPRQAAGGPQPPVKPAANPANANKGGRTS